MSAAEAPSLDLGEGGTRLVEDQALATWAGVARLLVKREDENPTGSHKDRGARAQIEECLRLGRRTAVISSSGNAALAAATYGTAGGVSVVALLSPMTEPARMRQVAAAGARVVVTTKPMNFTRRLSRVRGWPDLRPSQSAAALAGFRGLGAELAEELAEGTPVFGYASSGTTYQALGEEFLARHKRLPLHPVQAGLVNGLSRAFDRPGDGQRSLVGDLGVKVSDRAAEVVGLVRGSGGEAWWVADSEIREAGATLGDAGYQVAAECWAALAGVRQAARTSHIEEACLLLTGRALPADGSGTARRPAARGPVPPPATEFADVLKKVADLD